mmetsp:Transcript_8296/g.23734  ORF Transcript_8296/g.23734 Transcript_8296/m.23734 type:complete len:263 (+) Transcript_8296:741-1529(+)
MARGLRLHQGARHVPPRQLGTADVLDHRRVPWNPGTQPMIVLGVGSLAGGAEAKHAAPVAARDGVLRLPSFDDRRDRPEHRDPSGFHELAEGFSEGRALEDGDRRAVDEAGVKQPRPHHPAQVGGPTDDVALLHVVVEHGIGGRLQGGDVVPRNSLWLPGRAAAEENVRDVLGVAGDRLEVAGRAQGQELHVRQVDRPERAAEREPRSAVGPAREVRGQADHLHGFSGLLLAVIPRPGNSVVQGNVLVVPEERVLRDDRVRL